MLVSTGRRAHERSENIDRVSHRVRGPGPQIEMMSAIDLVVTVALGSTLATILLSRDVALLEGMTALLTLVAPLADAPKFKRLHRGALTWLRESSD